MALVLIRRVAPYNQAGYRGKNVKTSTPWTFYRNETEGKAQEDMVKGCGVG